MLDGGAFERYGGVWFVRRWVRCCYCRVADLDEFDCYY